MASNDDEDITLKINLDDEGFKQALEKAKGTLGDFGSGSDIQGLVDNFSQIKGTLGELAEGSSLSSITQAVLEFGAVLGAAGLAILALKEGLDLSLQAEQIEAVSKQFDILTANAGIAGGELKEAFLQATNGLLTDTEALKLANNAVIRLGASASELPEIMELARKSSLVMGTDLETAFSNITMAISSGNARLLKRAGLMVDVNAAERKYAHTLGIAQDSLSEAGKQQAILNAVLEEGSKKLDGIDESMKPVTTTWQQFKTAITEIGDAIALVFNRTLGPAVAGAVGWLKKLADEVKETVLSRLGTDAESSAAKIKILSAEIERLSVFAGMSKKVDDMLAQKRAELEELKQLEESSKPTGGSGSSQNAAAEKARAQDHQKALEDEKKFEQELDTIRKQGAAQEMQLAQNERQLKQAEADERLSIEQKLQADIAKIEANKSLNEVRQGQLIAQAMQNKDREIEIFEQQSFDRRKKMLDNFLSHSKGVFEGFSRAAEVASKQASDDLKNSAKLSQAAFDDLSTGAGDAFQEIGKGAAGGSNQMEHAVLGSLGKVAANYGKTMMLASLWPFNPAVFAAGAALEVLAGVLGQVGTGGGGSSSGSSASSTNAGTNTSQVSNTSTSLSSLSTTTQTQKAVTINVEGHIFDSPATAMRMVDLIRQAGDGSDYTPTQIGGTPYGS